MWTPTILTQLTLPYDGTAPRVVSTRDTLCSQPRSFCTTGDFFFFLRSEQKAYFLTTRILSGVRAQPEAAAGRAGLAPKPTVKAAGEQNLDSVSPFPRGDRRSGAEPAPQPKPGPAGVRGRRRPRALPCSPPRPGQAARGRCPPHREDPPHGLCPSAPAHRQDRSPHTPLTAPLLHPGLPLSPPPPLPTGLRKAGSTAAPPPRGSPLVPQPPAASPGPNPRDDTRLPGPAERPPRRQPGPSGDPICSPARPSSHTHRRRRRAGGVTGAAANEEAGGGGPLVFEFGGRRWRRLARPWRWGEWREGGGSFPCSFGCSVGLSPAVGPGGELLAVGWEASREGWVGPGRGPQRSAVSGCFFRVTALLCGRVGQGSGRGAARLRGQACSKAEKGCRWEPLPWREPSAVRSARPSVIRKDGPLKGSSGLTSMESVYVSHANYVNVTPALTALLNIRAMWLKQ